ncbi:MAG: ABC transporter ATP-binding protein [Firmicutes bacterium]|nr:ABC transporter ATP-binding protein [Bacillota bacterium]
MYLELKGISKRFDDAKSGETDAVNGVDLGIEKGELIALLGPSGSGKTTILRMIAGLEVPTEGDIYIEGVRVNDLSPADRKIGFVFQNYALFRYMTVYENVAFGLEVMKKSGTEIRKRVMELLELTELSDLKDRYPNQLSGGQQQRTAFARALATQPSLLLLDEPFAAIDAKVRKELRSWLRNMIGEVGITSIFVTHDQEEAVDMADRIVILREGSVVQTGAPREIYENPATVFVASFLGDPVILDSFSGFKGFEDINDSTSGSRIVLRPEHVEAFRDDNPKFHDLIPISENGTVRNILFRGDFLELEIEVNGIRLKCRRSLERRTVGVGEKMRVLIYRINVFSPSGAEVVKNSFLHNINPEFM